MKVEIERQYLPCPSDVGDYLLQHLKAGYDVTLVPVRGREPWPTWVHCSRVAETAQRIAENIVGQLRHCALCGHEWRPRAWTNPDSKCPKCYSVKRPHKPRQHGRTR